MSDPRCQQCNGALTWIPQYQRYYCHTCRRYPPTCPACGSDLFWNAATSQLICSRCQHSLTAPPPEADSTAAPLIPDPPPQYTPPEIQALFTELQQDHAAQRIDDAEYEQLLLAMKFLDPEGRFWTLGAQSGQWYYHDGVQWIQATHDPPPRLDLVTTP